ncbi:transposase [Pseudonocardia sp.]|uniref:transposase n=1 Tax=Pseudonocardia sp. TaxID=60912 RepID=UPI003D0FC8EB
MPRPRRWTDEQLAAAVAASRTLSEVCRRLGLRPGKYDGLRAHIRRLGIDASHLPRAVEGSPRTRRRFRDEDLVEAVRLEASVHGVLRRLGYTTSGGMFRYVVAHIRRLELDTSHFRGQAWARGMQRPRASCPLHELLVEGSTATSSTLRRRIIAAGLKPAHCEECGLSEWRGERLPLHLDHVNGDHTDNRIQNLRILCPNCHALTDTWCGRKNGRRTPTGQRGGA